MKGIKLLDCTLRDGGYVNDWNFGHKNLVSIFQRLIDAKADFVEVGFLDDRRPFDVNRSIMPHTDCVEQIFGNVDKKQTTVLAMIDYGTCDIKNLRPKNQSYIDGIRVIFKKHLMHEALDYCRQVKELGYKVFAQLVSITSYDNDDLYELIKLANDVEPYAVSIVDTYGLMHTDEMIHYYKILDENLKENINIGFHGHNNLQMAYANSVAFMEKESHHNIFVDGTLYGMGKSAGNAPSELLAMRLNDKYDKSYNIDSMLEAIEESVKTFYAVSPWGYTTSFYMCAKNRCHPNYISFLQEKQNLSISKIDEILKIIEPAEKKLLYDKLVAEKFYDNYTSENINEKESLNKLKKAIGNRKILLVGPGKNIKLQIKEVDEFISQNNPYIISINYIPTDIKIDCVFVTNSKRYNDMTLKLYNSDAKVLATSNIESRNKKFDFVVNRDVLLDKNENIIDNSFLMLVRLLKNINISEINCVGFDGYSDKGNNYFDPLMEYDFVKHEAAYLNLYMKQRILDFRKYMKINFITYSAYDEVENINGASI